MARSREITDNIINGNLSEATWQLLSQPDQRSTALMVCNVIDDLARSTDEVTGFHDYYYAVGRVRRLIMGDPS